MNPEERIVTWLISLGVLDSPKKTVCDPEEFLKSSLKNGVVLCKLINRLRPGSVEKVRELCLPPGSGILSGAPNRSRLYQQHQRLPERMCSPSSGGEPSQVAFLVVFVFVSFC
ncbi:Rho guanine nucleotide exchange factor 6 [Camelus dromedarius]|uniref:Rho guanine nucleotide exchange factor 6 n=1 Tax=Camelus dromedarius TaxID=9838 RepID=A0A5N4C1T8_CAMDR|nr:Rho guanine nucleotide exchange factor 6 [Camelus dromedarius]